MKEQLKVYSAALLGVSSPASSAFFNFVEPILQVVLLAGQIGVAAVTILYIVRKWQNARKK